jgi:hypothetical protein
MDNQHKKIKGYRDLTQDEIDLMNKIKQKGAELGGLIDEMSEISVQQVDNQLDGRWISIGQTHLQQGIMALVRAVARPESF